MNNTGMWIMLALIATAATPAVQCSNEGFYPPSDGRNDGAFNVSDYAAITNNAPLPDGIVIMSADGNTIIISTRSAIPVKIPAGTIIFQQGAIKQFPEGMVLIKDSPISAVPDRSFKYGMVTLKWGDYTIAGFNRVLKIGG